MIKIDSNFLERVLIVLICVVVSLTFILKPKEEVKEEVVINEDSFKKELSQGSVLFFGDGANKCQNMLSHPNAKFELGIYPSASDMIFIAYNKYENKEFEDLAYFEPFYLKDFLSGVNT